MRAEADIAVEPEMGAFARRTARDFCSVSTHCLAFENVAVQYHPVGNQGAPKGVAVRRRRSLLDQVCRIATRNPAGVHRRHGLILSVSFEYCTHVGARPCGKATL